ncbi:DUF6515 family protein [Winogradskyella sp. Asnod2-B02-A]|uniref:DUF6515 family protein n=1 Tax=Winogradskyella sp. Asnod2-B02-A TaxID=3160583 RepID=UPI0038651AFF
MKTFIKIYVIPAMFLAALSTQVSAQVTRRNSKEKTVKTTTTKRTVANNGNTRRVSSTKVTYKKPTRKVVSVRSLPKRTVINHKGQNYYYANNKFYTQSRGRYIVIAPKVGFRIKVLPPNYKRIRFNTHNYYNVNGTFYIQINNEYEVVDPEIGTVVYELPEDYEKVTIDGQTYYEYANVLYEKVQVDGTRAYEVIGIIDME